MRKIGNYSLLLILLILTSAHEFWLQPEKFMYKRGESVNIRFYVGENFEGENWKGNKEKINSLQLYYGGVQANISDHITGASGDSLQLNIYDEGNALIAFNSTNSFIELEPAKFTEYLKEDGLENTIRYRAEYGETDSIGREYYQRCSKTLLQIGSIQNNVFKTATTLPLDIIPQSNPYLLKDGDTLRAKLFFQKKALANGLVKIWHRAGGQSKMTNLQTDENGQVAFPVYTNGQWMISSVHMIRLDKDPRAQWQSYWGSFVWGYQ